MFPLPIATDLKLHTSCADSEKHRGRKTKNQRIVRPNLKERESGWEKHSSFQSQRKG